MKIKIDIHKAKHELRNKIMDRLSETNITGDEWGDVDSFLWNILNDFIEKINANTKDDK